MSLSMLSAYGKDPVIAGLRIYLFIYLSSICLPSIYIYISIYLYVYTYLIYHLSISISLCVYIYLIYHLPINIYDLTLSLSLSTPRTTHTFLSSFLKLLPKWRGRMT